MKFPTIVLAAGAAVLLVAVAIGQRMGNSVMQQATQQLQSLAPVAVTPNPSASPQPYGPDWKRSQSLSAAGDPHFPDPRVPPQPLPTPLPAPKPTPTPLATATPNPNIPIWRQEPLPTASALPAPSGGPLSPQGESSPEPTPS